nr:UPF0262 family protein [Oryzibacter oryziterrae]
MVTDQPEQTRPCRLVAVTLDEASISHISREVDHERRVAIYDLVDDNSFAPAGHDSGEFTLNLALVSGRLVMQIGRQDGTQVITHVLSLSPFRRIVRDYFVVCDSYYQAIKTASPSQIEAIDMGRRGLHNEGARALMERLDGKIVIDMNTARRLFTLIAVLQWKG